MGRRLKNALQIDRVQLNTRIPLNLKTTLDAIAIANNKELTDVVIEALSVYVKKQIKKAIAI